MRKAKRKAGNFELKIENLNSTTFILFSGSKASQALNFSGVYFTSRDVSNEIKAFNANLQTHIFAHAAGNNDSRAFEGF